MSLIFDERVQEVTVTTGTGALVLGGASPGYIAFADAGFANGDVFWGLIEHATLVERELAPCTYNAGSITRATPRKSSNAGAAVPFSAGIKTISIVAMANNANRSLRTLASGASYAMLANDSIIRVNKSAGSATAITLPASPGIGHRVTIVDGKGDAGTNNITITPAAGLVNGAASITLNTDRVTYELVYSGSEWSTLSVL